MDTVGRCRGVRRLAVWLLRCSWLTVLRCCRLTVLRGGGLAVLRCRLAVWLLGCCWLTVLRLSRWLGSLRCLRRRKLWLLRLLRRHKMRGLRSIARLLGCARHNGRYRNCRHLRRRKLRRLGSALGELRSCLRELRRVLLLWIRFDGGLAHEFLLLLFGLGSHREDACTFERSVDIGFAPDYRGDLYETLANGQSPGR